MTRFQSTIVALSLTESDSWLLRYAARLTRQGVCQNLHFVHVAPPHDSGAQGSFDSQSYVSRIQLALSRHFDAGPNYACRVVHGARLDQILGVAVEQHADLILLGHRRERSGRRSLARRLAMVSPCAVWMIPEGSPEEINRILVPIDFSAPSADALSEATGLAQQCGLPDCLALHVFFDPSSIRYDEHIDELRGEERAAFERFVAPIQTHGVRVDPLFEESPRTAQAILRVADSHQANLIVMGTRGRSHAAAILLGSVTSQTMTRTQIPLLALKHFGGRMSLFDALINHRFWEQPTPKTS